MYGKTSDSRTATLGALLGVSSPPAPQPPAGGGLALHHHHRHHKHPSKDAAATAMKATTTTTTTAMSNCSNAALMAQNVANTHDHLGHGHHVEEAKHELEVHGDAARQEREAYYQRERRKLQINEMLCCKLTR